MFFFFFLFARGDESLVVLWFFFVCLLASFPPLSDLLVLNHTYPFPFFFPFPSLFHPASYSTDSTPHISPLTFLLFFSTLLPCPTHPPGLLSNPLPSPTTQPSPLFLFSLTYIHTYIHIITMHAYFVPNSGFPHLSNYLMSFLSCTSRSGNYILIIPRLVSYPCSTLQDPTLTIYQVSHI